MENNLIFVHNKLGNLGKPEIIDFNLEQVKVEDGWYSIFSESPEGWLLREHPILTGVYKGKVVPLREGDRVLTSSDHVIEIQTFESLGRKTLNYLFDSFENEILERR